MNQIFSAAIDVQSWLVGLGWKFCIIGGVAVQRWGEPRYTQDVDLTLLTGFGDEEKYIAPLFKQFKARRPDAAAFALRNRVALLETSTGIPLDVAFGGLPFEINAVNRASPFAIGDGRSLLTCSAEDLIVHKCFANRPRDWGDVENILIRQRGKLNFSIVWTELEPLIAAKEEPEIKVQLKRLIAKVEKFPQPPAINQ